MNKQQINVMYTFYTLFLCMILSNTAHSGSIGELVTTEGAKFELSQFGSKDNEKNYFLKTTDRFIPMEEVRHITRIDTQVGRFAYLIVLHNGNYETGRQGLLFYEKVSFTDPTNGILKTAFTPVIKDRQQSGLIFTALVSVDKETAKLIFADKAEKVIEISYPNNIDRISLNFNEQQAVELSSNQQNTEILAQKNLK